MPSPVRLVTSVVGRLGGRQEAAAAFAAVGGIFVALALTVAGWQWAALVVVILSVLAELIFEPRSPAAAEALRQASFGVPMRWMLRVAVVVLVAAGDPLLFGGFSFAAQSFDPPSAVIDFSNPALTAFAVVAFALSLLLCARALHREYRLVGPLKPMRGRNIPGDVVIKDTPPRRTVSVVAAQLLCLVPLVAQAPWWTIVLAGLAACALITVMTLPDVKRSLGMRNAKRQTGFTPQLRAVQDFLDDYRPEVVVHLSGPETGGYQINTWLESLAHLDRRVFIVIRDTPLFGRLGKTSIPALELRDPGELLMLDFSSAQVSLYPSNTGNNIHLLRLPHMMSAFIGHGDSDKSASNNPFSRVYDELWVAGEAGADRYRRSGLNVHEDQYRFVGRPQVHAISREPRLGAEPVPTVLYAPTWEGVNLEQEYSSVAAVGEKVVAGLLAAQPPVRVVFKAHPFTGQRDAKYRDVLARIAKQLDEAATATGIDHRVVKGGPIDEWFNRSVALVTDVSSVVSDFVASEKPYAVFNHTELTDDEFRSSFPSTGAATIIGRDGRGIDELVAIVTGTQPDERSEARAALATYLLGPAEHRTLDHFAASVEGLIARAETERAQYRGVPTSEEPVTDA